MPNSCQIYIDCMSWFYKTSIVFVYLTKAQYDMCNNNIYLQLIICILVTQYSSYEIF